MPLGILIDKDLQNLDKAFVPIFSPEDSFILDYVQKFVFNNNTRISILDIHQVSKNNFVLESTLTNLENKYPDNISNIDQKLIRKEFLTKQDLMIISLESWKKLINEDVNWLENVPSVLIMKP